MDGRGRLPVVPLSAQLAVRRCRGPGLPRRAPGLRDRYRRLRTDLSSLVHGADSDIDFRFGIKVLDPRIYVGIGYIIRRTNYGYPNQSGLGFGIQKLPDFEAPFSVYGNVWYYPNIKGTYTLGVCGAACSTPAVIQGATLSLNYRMYKWDVGGLFSIPSTPIFINFGILGDQGSGKTNAPSNFNHVGGYAGLGVHF